MEKKGNKLRFGYKQHTGVDDNGLVVGVVTTSANESDVTHLSSILDKISLNKRATVKGDKGYKGNDDIIKEKGLKNRIMLKASKDKSLTKNQQKFNKLISKTRFRVERTFGSMRRWFNSGTSRYVGRPKMHTQHLMEAIAHNVYRAPRIIVSSYEM